MAGGATGVYDAAVLKAEREQIRAAVMSLEVCGSCERVAECELIVIRERSYSTDRRITAYLCATCEATWRSKSCSG